MGAKPFRLGRRFRECGGHVDYAASVRGKLLCVGLLDRRDVQHLMAVFLSHRAFGFDDLGNERNGLLVVVRGIVAFNRLDGVAAVLENRHLVAALGARQREGFVLFALLAAFVVARL